MSGFQRMIAIPQEEYLSLSSMQNVREPLAQHFYNLENRYTSEEKERDPYRRMLMQSSTLDQMRQVKEQMRESLTVSTPKPYLSRAKALFQALDNVIKYNEKGEIYSEDGNIVSGSRLEDLIQHAVRDRRRNLLPTGWTDFLSILRDHNIPKSLLNRYTLDEMENIVTHSTTTPSTPVASRPILKAVKRVKLKEEEVDDGDGASSAKQKVPSTKRIVKPNRSIFGPPYKSDKDLNFLKRFTNE